MDILYSQETKKIISDLESYYNKPVSLLPPLEIMKNYHVNLKTHLGWHRDCGGELEHDYCKEKLFKKDYLFTKVGIYLQNNTEYGGSIDIIKTSHKNFSKSQLILRKIKSIPLRFTQSFHKYFSKLYYLSDSKKENPETKSIYVSIEIIKEKNSTVKNSAGKILEYKIILDSKILLTDYLSGQKILDYKSSSFSSYRVQDQYSETLRLENTAAENILEKIYQDLLIKLSEKMLTEW